MLHQTFTLQKRYLSNEKEVIKGQVWEMSLRTFLAKYVNLPLSSIRILKPTFGNTSIGFPTSCVERGKLELLERVKAGFQGALI